jgi:hypothetical protein
VWPNTLEAFRQGRSHRQRPRGQAGAVGRLLEGGDIFVPEHDHEPSGQNTPPLGCARCSFKALSSPKYGTISLTTAHLRSRAKCQHESSTATPSIAKRQSYRWGIRG